MSSSLTIQSLSRSAVCSAALFTAACGLLGSDQARAADVSSRFDSGAEGWLVTDITSLPGAGVAATWDAGLQQIGTSDIATWTTYSAPTAFLGNKASFYGGSFSFQLTDNLKDDNADSVATFGIASGTVALYWFGGAPSTTGMTTFTASLSASDTRWRYGGLPTDFSSGTPASAAQFQAVLGAVTALRINADWKTAGNDITALDNVVLSASPVPEPTTAALLAGGVAALGLRLRLRLRVRPRVRLRLRLRPRRR